MAVASRRRHHGTAGSVGSNRPVAGHLSSHRTFSSRHLSGAAPIYEQGGGGRERPPASAAPPLRAIQGAEDGRPGRKRSPGFFFRVPGPYIVKLIHYNPRSRCLFH